MTSNNQTRSKSDGLTEALKSKLNTPASSAEFDLKAATDDVLKDVGLTTADSGGKLSFYGSDPILPSSIRFGTAAAIGLAARSVALSALWKQTTGEGQDISVDVRKALRRFCGFFEGKWETINGRGPSPGGYGFSPFFSDFEHYFFRPTRDGRHMVALDFYPGIRARTLNFLGASESNESINKAIGKWDALELENAAAEEGLVRAHSSRRAVSWCRVFARHDGWTSARCARFGTATVDTRRVTAYTIGTWTSAASLPSRPN